MKYGLFKGKNDLGFPSCMLVRDRPASYFYLPARSERVTGLVTEERLDKDLKDNFDLITPMEYVRFK